MLPTRKNSPQSQRKNTTHTRLTVRGSGAHKAHVPMAKAGNIPAGRYRSTIASIIEAKTAAGEDAVAVIYDLVSPKGYRWSMREILPVEGWPYEKFGDALIAAGLREGDDLSSAVGVVEDVELAYPNPRGLGHFKTRVPVLSSAEHQEEDSPSESAVHELSNEEDQDGWEGWEEWGNA